MLIYSVSQLVNLVLIPLFIKKTTRLLFLSLLFCLYSFISTLCLISHCLISKFGGE